MVGISLVTFFVDTNSYIRMLKFMVFLSKVELSKLHVYMRFRWMPLGNEFQVYSCSCPYYYGSLFPLRSNRSL